MPRKIVPALHVPVLSYKLFDVEGGRGGCAAHIYRDDVHFHTGLTLDKPEQAEAWAKIYIQTLNEGVGG